MADVAGILAVRGVRYAVIGAMAAALHGVVRASLDADAVVALQIREAQALQQTLIEEGYAATLRIGDVDDPIQECSRSRIATAIASISCSDFAAWIPNSRAALGRSALRKRFWISSVGRISSR
jgi:hypothetical protein